jgi:hypothetical protein
MGYIQRRGGSLQAKTHDVSGRQEEDCRSAEGALGEGEDEEGGLERAASYTYTYDGDGNRAEKANGSTGTLYWRGPSGDPISESSLTGVSQEEYVFFRGQRVARRDHAACDRWMRLMNSAFREAAPPTEAEQVLRKFLDGMSSFVINRAEP